MGEKVRKKTYTGNATTKDDILEVLLCHGRLLAQTSIKKSANLNSSHLQRDERRTEKMGATRRKFGLVGLDNYKFFWETKICLALADR